MRLKGKTCVVTAAGQGIGAATARAFAREGAKVWATDVDAAKLKALEGVDGVTTHKLDVLDKAAIGLARRRRGLSTCCSIVPGSSTTVRCSTRPTSSGGSPSTSTSAACSGRSRRSCRAWWARAAGSIINMSSAASSVKGRCAPLHLWHDQGRGYRAYQVGGRGLCRQRRAMQCDLPGHGPNSLARRAHLGSGRRCGCEAVLLATPADRPFRLGRGDRGPCHLSRQR
jgi:hypothetical protein